MSLQRLPDYYAILQVTPTAEAAVIEAAYRQLTRLYHPDLNDAPDARDRVQALIVAYAVLRDPTRRADYDAQRARQQRAATHLAGLAREGDWYVFRLGTAADAYAVIARLEGAVPPDARQWDAARQVWRVHADYEAALRGLFADFATPTSLAFAPPPVDPAATPNGPLLAAVAVCLVAAAIVASLLQTPEAVAWRRAMSNTVYDAFLRLDSTASISMTLVFLGGIAGLVVLYIAYTLGRPSRPSR